MKSIIIGINGQDGFYLQQLLQEKGHQVIGIARTGADFYKNIFDVEISKPTAIAHFIQKHQADYIFHFAANSSTQHEHLFQNHQSICTATICILEAVKQYSPHSKVFISGSGLQFKNQGKAIKESDEFEARDAYSMSRIQSVYAARYYRYLGLKVYVGYFFNHDSPRRPERHMAKKIATFAKKVQQGTAEKLEVGNIDVVKEWAYAKDIMEALWIFMQQENILEINLASGITYSIKDWIATCFQQVNLDWQPHIVIAPNFIPEYQCLIADASLIHSLAWKPQTSFQELAQLMLAS